MWSGGNSIGRFPESMQIMHKSERKCRVCAQRLLFVCLELILMPVLCYDDAYGLISAKDGQYLILV